MYFPSLAAQVNAPRLESALGRNALLLLRKELFDTSHAV